MTVSMRYILYRIMEWVRDTACVFLFDWFLVNTWNVLVCYVLFYERIKPNQTNIFF